MEYKNYDRYIADCWDIEGKKRHHELLFPQECARAEELGRKLAQAAACE